MKYCFDFLWITENHVKKDVTEIYPTFLVDNSTTDLMVRGNDFYAVWLDDKKLWSTNEQYLIQRIDKELDKYVEEHKERLASDHVVVKHMRNGDTKMINKFHDYCKKQMRESYHDLDEKIIFSSNNSLLIIPLFAIKSRIVSIFFCLMLIEADSSFSHFGVIKIV